MLDSEEAAFARESRRREPDVQADEQAGRDAQQREDLGRAAARLTPGKTSWKRPTTLAGQRVSVPSIPTLAMRSPR